MEDEEGTQEPTPTNIEDHVKSRQKPPLARLEDSAIRFLYSLIERPADSPRFWIATGVGMFACLVGPMIAIAIYFFGREHGFFE